MFESSKTLKYDKHHLKKLSKIIAYESFLLAISLYHFSVVQVFIALC